MTMNPWFGPDGPWAPFQDDAQRRAPPAGRPCLYCDEPIAAQDEGEMRLCFVADGLWEERPVHKECALRMSLGGANHQRGTCSCCGGPDDPDPPGLTRRAAARAAVVAWELRARGARTEP